MSTLLVEPTNESTELAEQSINLSNASTTESPKLESLGVTSLSQYVKMQNCDRFLCFRLAAHEDRALRAKWSVEIQPLTPLLRESGQVFESAVEEQLAQGGERVVNLGENSEAGTTLDWLRNTTAKSGPVILLQPAIGGQMGRYSYTGVKPTSRRSPRSGSELRAFLGTFRRSRTLAGGGARWWVCLLRGVWSWFINGGQSNLNHHHENSGGNPYPIDTRSPER